MNTPTLLSASLSSLLPPKVSPELKRFVLGEFAGEIMCRSVFITKRRCQYEDGRNASKQTDALIAAVAPFVEAAIPQDEKVRVLNEAIAQIAPPLRSATARRETLARGRRAGSRASGHNSKRQHTLSASFLPCTKNDGSWDGKGCLRIPIVQRA